MKVNRVTQDALTRLRPFVGAYQLRAIQGLCRGEEGEWYQQKVDGLAKTIDRIPLPYMSDGQGEDATVYLHYFTSAWDFYILEKDTGEVQEQAFGLVAGMETELGYISIDEITRAGAEIDLHWTPKPLREVRATLSHA